MTDGPGATKGERAYVRVRELVLSGELAPGAVLNQADLARTLLDFTYVPIRAMGRLGVGLRPHERDDVHHLFRYIAHLLGIAEDMFFLPAHTSVTRVRRLGHRRVLHSLNDRDHVAGADPELLTY